MDQFANLPPFSLEAEQCLLASMMLDRKVVWQVAQLVTKDSFYQTDHQIIFGVIMSLCDREKPVDAVILREELLKASLLEEVGGAKYLAQLLNTVPSAAHALHYAGIVRDKYMLRQLISASNDVIRDCYAPHEKSEAIVSAAFERFNRIATRTNRKSSVKLSEQCFAEYEVLSDPESRSLMTYGFDAIDAETGGIGVGEMTIIGARPSMGKSTLARGMLVRASRRGVPTMLVSLEETDSKIARNVLSAEASIDNWKLRRRDLSAEDHRVIVDKMVNEINALPAWIVDDCFTPDDIRTSVAYHVAKYGVKLVLIDYLQRIRAPGKDRFSVVTEASLSCSRLVKDLNIGGVVLAQLSRQLLGRDDKRPNLGDLRESGQIEQDADAIMLLHREDYYHLQDPTYFQTHEAELSLAKMRDGERGQTIKLRTELRFQRFLDTGEEPNQ